MIPYFNVSCTWKKLEGLGKTFLFPIDHSICQAFIPMGIFCSIFRFAFMFVSCFQCFQCLRSFVSRVTTAKRHKGKLWNFNYYKVTLFIISHSCIQKKLREWMLLNRKPDYINFILIKRYVELWKLKILHIPNKMKK